MFSSAENSPYGILPERTIPIIESNYPIIDDIVYGKLTKVKKIAPFQAVCHKLMSANESSVIALETFADDEYVDLDRLGQRARKREKVLNQPRILDNSVEPDNIIALSPKHLSAFKGSLKKHTKEIKDTFIEKYLPQIIGIDDASSYVEAFVRDGLGLDNFKISADLLPYIQNAIKTDFMSMLLKGLTNLSAKDRSAFKAGYITDALASARVQAKVSLMEENHKRYQENLDNPSGHLIHPLGIKKSRNPVNVKDGKA